MLFLGILLFLILAALIGVVAGLYILSDSINRMIEQLEKGDTDAREFTDRQ